jgi:hypothetical protein
LGGECLVVGKEKHALTVILAGKAKGEFEGVPGLARPGAAVDEELAILRKLVEQGEAGGELPLEELLGVINESALFFREGTLAEGFQHGPLLKGSTGLRTWLPKIRSQVETQFSKSFPVTSQFRGIPWKFSTSVDASTPGTQRAFSMKGGLPNAVSLRVFNRE